MQCWCGSRVLALFCILVASRQVGCDPDHLDVYPVPAQNLRPRSSAASSPESLGLHSETTTSAPSRELPPYVGCFQDTPEPEFCCGPRRHGYTVHTCEAKCREFKYFALQDGGLCACDNEYASPASEHPRLPDSACGMPGVRYEPRWGPEYLTGRARTNSVFRVRGPAQIPAPVRKHTRPAVSNPPNWLGCYMDQAAAPDFCCGPKEGGYSVEQCEAACVEYQYFALQDGGHCSCDNSYGDPATSYSRTMDKKCAKGDLPHTLGGEHTNAVYAVQSQDENSMAQSEPREL